MRTKGSKKNPIWLEKRWEKRKQDTVLRVKTAVQALIKEGCSVSIRSVCDKVRELTGHSMSPNTIKQNSVAYDLYRQHVSRKTSLRLKDPVLLQLFSECPQSAHPALKSKIARLKRITKEDLIVRLIRSEREVKESKAIEARLRERLIEIEIFVHRNKGKSD